MQISKFVQVKLRAEDVRDMITTYELLVWNNEGEGKKFCKKVLKALKDSIKDIKFEDE
jgi:hypothetical protein